MNRAYKVIYNKKRRLVQVVSEISGGFTRAERQGRRSLLEMYPLYWTPSKEGTFCVIRLNLS